MKNLNRKINLKALLVLAVMFFSASQPVFALFEDQEKITLKKESQDLQKEVDALKKEIANVTSDRDNVLKQAKNFMAEKETLTTKIDQMKGSGSQATLELESLRKEDEILKSEVQKLTAARTKDQEIHLQEKQDLEKKVAELDAQKNSLAATMQQYPPEKIQQFIEDRNRLEQENTLLARKILEKDKEMEASKLQMKPLELDREELQRIRTENKEYQKRMGYVADLEKRQKELVKENAELNEKNEVLKSKFKEAVPGLAKAGRISQKMMRENADMHYNLGTIFLHNKQYREAIKEYERVLELRPSDPETHYNLGVLYDDYLKDREKALYHYQKYLAVNPKSPDAKKVESYILSLELEQKVR